MIDQLWIYVLSSSLISGILGASIAGAFALRGKRDEYRNDYYKSVLKRRIEAYEKLESLINALKLTVLDNDQRPYHRVFYAQECWGELYKLFIDATSHPLWLTDEVFDKTRELNIMFLHASSQQRDLIEFGKNNYEPIAELRSEIERIVAMDMLALHDIESFLKRKRDHQSGFSPIDVRG